MKDKSSLIIIGAGGHGKVALEIALLSQRYKHIFFLDDREIQICNNIKVIGKTNELYKFIDDYFIFVAIGDNKRRKELMKKLILLKASIPTLIHPSAVISSYSCLGIGVIVMPNAVINSSSKIGDGVIINTAATVDHDNFIGNYSHVSVGCHLGGNVIVGKNVFLGIGTIIKNKISICENTIIGAGAVVVKDIKKEGVYIGNPASIKNSIH